jgi:hypothetical protein
MLNLIDFNQNLFSTLNVFPTHKVFHTLYCLFCFIFIFITQWHSAKLKCSHFTVIFIYPIVVTYQIHVHLPTVFLFSVIWKHIQSFKNSSFLSKRKDIDIPIWIISGKFQDILRYKCIYSDFHALTVNRCNEDKSRRNKKTTTL